MIHRFLSLCVTALILICALAGCSSIKTDPAPTPDEGDATIEQNVAQTSEQITTTMANLYGTVEDAAALKTETMTLTANMKVQQFMPLETDDETYSITFSVGYSDLYVTCNVPLNMLEELNAVSVTTDSDGNKTVAMLSNLTQANSVITCRYLSDITNSVLVTGIDRDETESFIRSYLISGKGISLLDRAFAITGVDFLFSDYIVSGVFTDDNVADELYNRYTEESHTLFISTKENTTVADFYNIAVTYAANETDSYKISMFFPDFNGETVARKINKDFKN